MSSSSISKIIACNWKMNLSRNEAVYLAKELVNIAKPATNELWLAPPAILIADVQSVISGSSIKLGTQNIHWEKSGAYTGETSPAVLKDFNCTFSIIGHSERREIFNESDELISKRLHGCCASGITPILCIGESLLERQQNLTNKKLKQQIVSANLDKLSGEIVIAYEPIWAIGTGKVPSLEEISETHLYIRETLCEIMPGKSGVSTKLLYGGSVTSDNFKNISSLNNVDGGLVGGASLDAKKVECLLN